MRPLPRFSVSASWILRAITLAVAASAAGCDTDETDASSDGAGANEPVASLGQTLQGQDGALTVSAAGTVVNQYAVLAANATAGATSLDVTNVADLTSGAFGPLAAGDLLLVAQMQGATIDTSNSSAYGSVTALGNAGRHEFVTVASVAGNTVTLGAGCGLTFSYTAGAGRTQIVRVPQLASLTVAAGASITAPAWDGLRGGIVSALVQGTATIEGSVDANARGFRGGALDAATSNDVTIYRSTATTDGAEKGESIAGDVAVYDGLSGRFGRGAPANGGGGGNGHNAGGGGGANGNNGRPWTGQGVMDGTVAGAAAWLLDPGFIANGNALTNSAGGGRGGYTYSFGNQDALTVGPGAAAWAGDQRRERGGLGGRPLDNDTAGRLFFGGGGGAGDANNGGGGRGGRGGGIVYLIAGSVAGTGSITANGASGDNTVGGHNDGPGGGGGGGAIVVSAGALSGVTVSAAGGAGGNQLIGNTEAEGPGGGGGGGFIALAGGAVAAAAPGGSHGTTSSTALTEFLPNGATRGAAGQPAAAATTVLGCLDLGAPETTIATFEPNPTNDPTGEFTFASNDPAATFECSLDGAAFTACPASFTTPSLADGSHDLLVRARDSFGNLDPTPASYTWTVDTAVPDTTIATFEPNPTNDPTGDFTFTSNDPAATFECSLDGGAFAPCPAGFSTPSLANGSHDLAVRARDLAGNVDPTPATYTWTVDASTPDTTIVTFEPNPTNDPTGEFAFTSDDPGATFECSIDGGAFAPCPASFTTPSLAEGSHELQVRARDATDNVDPTPATYTWTVDTTAPDTTIATFEPDPTGDPTGEFTFTSNEPGATFECSLDGAAFAPCPASFTTPSLANGSHELQVRATDPAGNVDATPASYTWTVVDDADSDGLADTTETDLGTDPNDADSDDDGVPDGAEPSFDVDSDGDGLINALDPDSDDDGLYDGTELGLDCSGPDTDTSRNLCRSDADPATTTNPLDADSDDGGASDGSEDANRNGELDAGERDPTAGNGADDDLVTDADDDGLGDALEDELGSDPNDADTDDDGVLDGAEPNPSTDTDGDGLLNVLDVDSDDDGLFDGTEIGLDCDDAATDVSFGFCVADGDAGATTTSAVDADTDDGGVRDGSEDSDLDGVPGAGETDPTAGNGDDDDGQADGDDDGLGDDLEAFLGSDPADADSDDDGVLDGDEANPSSDTDGDGLRNVLDVDSDDDALLDGTEVGSECDHPDTDVTKRMCRADGDDGATTTSMVDADSDDGGVDDGSEDANLDGTVDAGESDPTRGNESDDASVEDGDADGLGDLLEEQLGTDPDDADSDDDGVLDGAEPNPSTDTDGDGLLNVLDVDSDDDALLDGTELGLGCDQPATDVALGHCTADADPSTTTSPVDPDSDDGGAMDGSEDANLDGAVGDGEGDPTDGNAGDDSAIADADGDGLSDDLEAFLGSDPDDADSDDDGLLDGDEPNPSDDHDGDGDDNVLDEDSDADSLFDGTEAGNDCDAPDTDVGLEQCIADGDAGATTTGVLQRDTDGGGADDGDEDEDHDGIVDEGERDPNEPADDVLEPAGSGGGGGGVGGSGGEGVGGGGGGVGGGGSSASTGGATSTASAGAGTPGATSSVGSGGAGGADDDSNVYAEGSGLFCNAGPAPRTGAPGFWLALAMWCSMRLLRRR